MIAANSLLRSHVIRACAILGVVALLFVAEQWQLAAAWACIWIGIVLGLYAKQQNDLRELVKIADQFIGTSPPSYQNLSLSQLEDSKQLSEALRQRLTLLAELEKQTKSVNAWMSRAADSLPDGLIVLDKFDMVAWYNRAASQLHGINRTQLPIHHFIRLPAFAAAMDQRPTPVSIRAEFLDHPGKVFELLLLVDSDFKVVVSRDITERDRVDRLRSDFIANVSHEIRTPLTVVAGYAESIGELDLPKESRQRYLDMIIRQSKVMQALVADLLTLSRLENTAEALDEDVELANLIHGAVDTGRALSNGKHQLSAQVSGISHIKGNRQDLESALNNLVSNAVRYSPAGGDIRITWDGTSLSVQDNGLGIAGEHIPLLTERFYRVDKSRSREHGGTGLGLAIVKRIAARHHAKLVIESILGKGSTFSIVFPKDVAQ